ncbi:acetyl-CoA carboxylase biotin carboxyl carrier protein [Thermopolyspora sp. NPDC052614]|uniref:acetyl-CoA carboxylase biotin carboxyl carrier protein n=1 Tax=Thermopolyspora sp. NPDC052614 TaxID=3155682 RepID=UPI00342E2012
MTEATGSGPNPVSRSRPEDLLAWVAGYAVELNHVGGGPLRRMAVTCGGTTVEVEWAPPPERAGVPVSPGRVSANGDGGRNGGDPRRGGRHERGDHFDHFKDGEATFVVASPMVGTFYRAPEPGAAPYVEVGDTVEAGQQVGIVEAMKLMNPIVAERPGRVVEVIADDGSPVEYDQPLIVLVPCDGQ